MPRKQLIAGAMDEACQASNDLRPEIERVKAIYDREIRDAQD